MYYEELDRITEEILGRVGHYIHVNNPEKAAEWSKVLYNIELVKKISEAAIYSLPYCNCPEPIQWNWRP